MRRVTTAILLFGFLALKSLGQSKEINLEGIYQCKNLYVQDASHGYCTFQILVNGTDLTWAIEGAAYEIRLDTLDMMIGDSVFITLKHRGDCIPKFLNPGVLIEQTTYDFVSKKVTADTVLRWTATYQRGKADYRIQQFKWNKWVKVGSVTVTPGDSGTYAYSVASYIHSGENKFRVDRGEPPGCRYNSSVKFRGPGNDVPELSFVLNDDRTRVLFTSKTRFEIYDAYGNIVSNGNGASADISNIRAGTYYINYDKEMDKFLVRRKYRNHK